ncbi:hypothetical protein [Mycoplasma sp. 1018B]|uniref:hypothetical protein n=1 Tax=Mycoplasma sp. 1018B TaxID=2967302 RepID=UPI00211CFF6D|nr:hypothetical protein [Mycoplasma sp. 1018B]UUM19442.1 hypothetical protein NPA14_01065 [Mycoplasma sp. 1018B]
MKNQNKNKIKKIILGSGIVLSSLTFMPVLAATSVVPKDEFKRRIQTVINTIQRQHFNVITRDQLMPTLSRMIIDNENNDNIQSDFVEKLEYALEIAKNMTMIGQGRYINLEGQEVRANNISGGGLNNYYDPGNQRSYVASHMADIIVKRDFLNLTLEQMKERIKNEHLRAQTIDMINTRWPLRPNTWETKGYFPNETRVGLQITLSQLMTQVMNHKASDIAATREKFLNIHKYYDAMIAIKDNKALNDQARAQWDNLNPNSKTTLAFTTRKEWISLVSSWMKNYEANKENFEEKLKEATIKATAISDIINFVNGTIGLNDVNAKTDLIKKINAIDYRNKNGLTQETKYELLKAIIDQIKVISNNNYLTQKDKDALINNLATVFTPNIYDNDNSATEEMKKQLVNNIKLKIKEVEQINQHLTQVYQEIQAPGTTNPNGEETLDNNFLTLEEIKNNINLVDTKDINSNDYVSYSSDYVKRNQTLIKIGKLNLETKHKPKVSLINDLNVIAFEDSQMDTKLNNEYKRAQLIKYIEEQSARETFKDNLIEKTIEWPQINEANSQNANTNFENELNQIKVMFDPYVNVNNRSEITQNNIDIILNRYAQEIKNASNYDQLANVKTKIEERISLLDQVKNSNLKKQEKAILYSAIANLDTDLIQTTNDKSQAVKNLETIIEQLTNLNNVTNIENINENTLNAFRLQIASWDLQFTQEQINYAMEHNLNENNANSKLNLFINTATKTPQLVDNIKNQYNNDILNTNFNYSQIADTASEAKSKRIKNKLDLIDKINATNFENEDKNKLIVYITTFLIDNDTDLNLTNSDSKNSLLNLVLNYANELINDDQLNLEQKNKYLKQLFTKDPAKITVENFKNKITLIKQIQQDSLIGSNDKKYFYDLLDNLNPSDDDFQSNYQNLNNDFLKIATKRNIVQEINTKLNEIIAIVKTNDIEQILPFINKEQTLIENFKNAWNLAQSNKDNDNLRLNSIAFYTDIRDNLNASFTNLDFDLELTQKLERLQTLTHISNEQKQQIRNTLLQIRDNTNAKNLLDQIIILESVLSELKNKTLEENTVKNSDNYNLETIEKRNDYDNALIKAKEKIEELENFDFNNINVNNALIKINELSNLYTNLENAQNNLEGKKSQLKNKIDKAKHLDKMQKENFKKQIDLLDENNWDDNSAEQIIDQAFAQAKENVNNFIEQMNNLNIQEKQTFKNNVNLADLDDNLIDKNIDLIYQEAQNLHQLRQELIDQLNKTQNLNDSQKTALKNEIDNADNDNKNTLKTYINNLEQAMLEYRNIEKVDKNTINYQLADENLKDQYDQYDQSRDQIINSESKQNVTLEKIKTQIKNLNEAINNLNGQANLLKKQEETINLIKNNFMHLTNAQLTTLENLIKQANNYQTIDDIQNNAQKLNNQMQILKDYINNDNNLKESQKYNQATQIYKNEYDKTFSASRELLNELNDFNNPNLLNFTNIEIQNNSLQNKIDNLNGEIIAKAKENAINKINTFKDLDIKHKEQLIELIKTKDTTEKIENLTNQAEQLNTLINNAKNYLNQKDNIKESSLYLYENQENKANYDHALNDLETIINNLLQTELTDDNLDNNINELIAKTTKTEQTLNNLDGKRKNLKDKINKMIHLVQEEKNQLNDEINTLEKDLTNQQINQLKTKAFNEAKANVKTKINQLLDLAQEEKDQLNDEIDKALIDDNVIDQKLQDILDKANEANKKKTNLKDFLENTQYLNDAQKTALRNEITLAHSNQIDQLKTKIQALDNLMKEYKEIEVVDKNDIKYSQADENPQKVYDNALEERESIIDKTNGLNLNKEQIEAKINELKQAENNLNGQEKVKKAQENAISRINNEYSSLTEAQKTKAIEKINQANNLEQVNQADNENRVLNGQMQTLRDYLAKEKTLKTDNNYLNALPDKKQVYDQEIIKTQNLLKQLENNNDEDLLNENLVNQQNQNLHNAIDNLNGNNITEARKQVIDYINQLNDLNNKQKENLIAQVNKEVENDKILAIKDLANNINQTMQNLKNQLAKYDKLDTDKKYLNATSEKKLTFEDIENQAANLVDKEKGANVIDQKTIDQLTKDLEAKYNDLDGEQLLKNKQNQAKEKIDQLTELNNAQKEALKNEIDNALLIADVDDIANKALTLDNLMQQLANTLQDLENELNQENNDSYKAASPRTKNNYDKLKNQALDLLKTNSMQNLDSQAVNQLEKI